MTLTAASKPPVHLRARGEHKFWAMRHAELRGSSPRTRRTPRTRRSRRPHLRFISAHAENTRAGLMKPGRTSVHLRARGEHKRGFRGAGAKTGSSPRTRRTLKESLHHEPHHRFISAHAENTQPPDPASIVMPVHLRARGEHSARNKNCGRSGGSSPRTRRTQPQALQHQA